MNLHRSSGQPDWADVPVAKRTSWQRLAARTNGFVAPGNMLTVAGLVLVLVGLALVQQQEYWWGLATVGVGRLCDIWDGMAADRTGTKSPLGEALDASSDKVASLAAFILLVTAHIISLPVAGILLLPNLSNAGLTLLANGRGVVLHPSRTGKLFMAAMWVALVCFILTTSMQWSSASWLHTTGVLFVAISFTLGVVASTLYLQALRDGLKSARPSGAPSSPSS